MSSSDDEIQDYLINHGFSRAEVRRMSDKERQDTLFALLESNDLQKISQSNEQNNLKEDPINNYSKATRQDPVFNKEIENAGLNDDEALRVALKESIDYSSNSNVHNDANNSDSNPSLKKSLFEFASNTVQHFRDIIHSGESFLASQQDRFFIGTSSDDEFIQTEQKPSKNTYNQTHQSHYPSQNNFDLPNRRREYQPPPPPHEPSNNNQNKRSNLYTNTIYDNYYPPNNQNNYDTKYQSNDNSTLYKQDGFNYASIPNIGHFYPYDKPQPEPSRPDSNNFNESFSISDDESDDFNNSHKIIQRQNEEIQKLEQEVAKKEREENEKKLLEEEENNVKEACQVSLADEIIYLLDDIPPEPPEPNTPSEKKSVVSLQIIMHNGKKIERRFNDSDKGIFVYAFVAGTTLDSDEKLYMNSFELKMPMGNVLDKNLTLGEQNVRGKVRFIVSELDL